MDNLRQQPGGLDDAGQLNLTPLPADARVAQGSAELAGLACDVLLAPGDVAQLGGDAGGVVRAALLTCGQVGAQIGEALPERGDEVGHVRTLGRRQLTAIAPPQGKHADGGADQDAECGSGTTATSHVGRSMPAGCPGSDTMAN